MEKLERWSAECVYKVYVNSVDLLGISYCWALCTHYLIQQFPQPYAVSTDTLAV